MNEGKCPKCGAEESKNIKGLSHVIFYRCGSTHFKGRTIDQSQWCYGRADAIRELTEWRTGEPPEGEGRYVVRSEWLKGFMQYDVITRNSDDSKYWDLENGDSGRLWHQEWQWLPIPQ